MEFEKDEASEIIALETDYDFFCGMTSTKEITQDEVNKNKANYNLLDVREASERDEYHIGGQHIPLGQLSKRFQEIDISLPIVVYCKSGKRSNSAISYLKEQLDNAVFYNLKEGL